MGFISKVELKKQLKAFGVKVEGNYVKRSYINKVLSDDHGNLQPSHPKNKGILYWSGKYGTGAHYDGTITKEGAEKLHRWLGENLRSDSDMIDFGGEYQEVHFTDGDLLLKVV